MALEKSISWKNFTLKYWVIWGLVSNKKANTTKVFLAPYESQEARLANISNFIKDEIKTVVIAGHGLTLKQAYTKVKALSVPYNYVISQAVPEVKDPDTGEVTQVAIAEVIAIRDHNFFKDAISLLT